MNVLVAYILVSHLIMFSAVMTGSMSPTVNKGDLILLTSYHNDIREGDIIMFDSPEVSYPVLHRVYAITSSGIVTKGDASDRPDQWTITDEDVLGRAVLIFERPVVIPSLGNYFIVGDENDNTIHIGPYGDEYTVAKNLINMIRSFGLAIFVVLLFYSFVNVIRVD